MADVRINEVPCSLLCEYVFYHPSFVVQPSFVQIQRAGLAKAELPVRAILALSFHFLRSCGGGDGFNSVSSGS